MPSYSTWYGPPSTPDLSGPRELPAEAITPPGLTLEAMAGVRAGPVQDGPEVGPAPAGRADRHVTLGRQPYGGSLQCPLSRARRRPRPGI
jgi:hypothetical protein